VLGPALSEIETALTALSDGRGHPAGPLRITMPLLAARDVIAPRLGEFTRLYPEIELEIATDDRFQDIVEQGFDAGLRLGEHLEADMVAVRVSEPWRGAVVAAPSYFAERHRPLHPRDLSHHICIRRRFSSGTIYRWEFEKDGRAISVDVQGSLILSDQTLMHQAAIDGAGLAYIFDARVHADIEEGRLVRVLEDWCPPFDGFSIYYPSRRQMRPALRAFIDFFRWRG
jgi:DNA-binding transcriptional LysR family regulator